jgi:hypothetical protein
MGVGRMVRGNLSQPVAWRPVLADVPRALAAGPHSPPALLSGDGTLAGWTDGVPGAQMYVRACGRRVFVVDARVSVRVRVASAYWG